MIIEGKVWKFGDDINTDLIYPNVAFRMPMAEKLKMVFSANRPGWVDQVGEGDIIVGGQNFGTGSSRPGSELLKGLKVGALVADSINGLFFRNSINYGLPALQCPGVKDAFEDGDIAEIDYSQGTITNKRTGKTLQGIRVPNQIQELAAAGGIIPLLKKENFLD